MKSLFKFKLVSLLTMLFSFCWTTEVCAQGSGTKDDPYLIENGANLYWISQKASAGSGDNYIVRDVFNGVYFKQTAETLAQLEDVRLFKNYIRIDSAVEWAQDNSKPVIAYKKSSRASKEYMELTKEVIEYAGR